MDDTMVGAGSSGHKIVQITNRSSRWWSMCDYLLTGISNCGHIVFFCVPLQPHSDRASWKGFWSIYTTAQVSNNDADDDSS